MCSPGLKPLLSNSTCTATKWLSPEKRSAGLMMFYKTATVEYHPVGVMGAIVPWNYPFHNVFNPLLANLFAGNALVRVGYHFSLTLFCSQNTVQLMTAGMVSAGSRHAASKTPSRTTRSASRGRRR